MKKYILILLSLSMIFAVIITAPAQKKHKKKSDNTHTISYDTSYYAQPIWRCIGPFRGGRSAAVTGVPGKDNLYYFGSTGGGVWQTEDGGNTWTNISDGFFGGSIGAVAVSTSDPNVIYVGEGEVTVRGNVSSGNGIWKSEDAGKTWVYKGLPHSMHIPRIRIHPKNPDLVYAAVLGNLYKPSTERGVYRSNDGGKTWERILFSNENAGAVDLILDPSNPRVIYASTWNVRRTPYSLSSGGPGSGLWKSTDGGDTWKNISKNKGMPKAPLGIIGIAVSPAKRGRVWAIVEALSGGVFRSEDGGDTWRRTNDSRALRQRAWYYSRIYADPADEDVVYVVNVAYHKSKDGGATFKAYHAPHGDHHDLWIAPENPKRMIIADDGGAQVTTDGGENWTTYYNQPTAQFYRVTTDNHFPYRIYGAQQDNSTVRILHRTEGNSIGERDWEPTAGGESASIAVDPLNDDIVYAGSYGGFLTRVNHATKETRAINVWPDDPMGHGAEDMKYRFQWNFPVFFSPHNPHKLYVCSNHVHLTTNEGQSWTTISPDLTRNDSTKLRASGGPITKDNTGVEYYCTIFAAVESPLEEGLIWTGSDDGLVHLTRDGGKNWTNVTPPGMPEWIQINSIETNPFVKGGAYLAATTYKSGDYRPYLYKTIDYGKTWIKITDGIAETHFTRVIRADKAKPGLLYCGTEYGMYISFDDGASWHPFQGNLPLTPVTDLTIKNDNLIAATQGRSFWIIDDLTPLQQLDRKVISEKFYLFKPIDSYRMKGGAAKDLKTRGANHPGGVMVYFYLKNITDSSDVSLKFYDQAGKLIRKFSTQSKDKKDTLEITRGMNRFVWNMRYPDAKDFKGMILWWASLTGPKAIPGDYKVTLCMEKDSLQQSFKILKDPRSQSTGEDFKAQFEFLLSIRNKLSEVHGAIAGIRKITGQIDALKKKLEADSAANRQLIRKSEEIKNELVKIEQALYQTKNKSNQDPLNFPIRLNNKLAHLTALAGMGDFRPTDQDLAVKDQLISEIDTELNKLKNIKATEIAELNRMVHDAGIVAIEAD